MRERAETECFWHESVRVRPGGGRARRVSEALEWLDAAQEIRVCTGSAEEMHALREAYAGDTHRHARHAAKTVDVGFAAHRLGHTSTLHGMLTASGQHTRAHTEGLAEARWREGSSPRWRAQERSGHARWPGYCWTATHGPRTDTRYRTRRYARAGGGTRTAHRWGERSGTRRCNRAARRRHARHRRERRGTWRSRGGRAFLLVQGPRRPACGIIVCLW